MNKANIQKVQLRDIAKMLASVMPVWNEPETETYVNRKSFVNKTIKEYTIIHPAQNEYTEKVETILATLKKLDRNSKLALASAYIFSSKVPRQDREDLFQDIVLEVLKNGTKDEPLAYSIARCDWRNRWEKRYNHQARESYSLDTTIEDDDGFEISRSELLVGDCEFEAKEIGYLDGCRLWDSIPTDIKPIVQKRLEGKALTPTEANELFFYSLKLDVLKTGVNG